MLDTHHLRAMHRRFLHCPPYRGIVSKAMAETAHPRIACERLLADGYWIVTAHVAQLVVPVDVRVVAERYAPRG